MHHQTQGAKKRKLCSPSRQQSCPKIRSQKLRTIAEIAMRLKQMRQSADENDTELVGVVADVVADCCSKICSLEARKVHLEEQIQNIDTELDALKCAANKIYSRLEQEGDCPLCSAIIIRDDDYVRCTECGTFICAKCALMHYAASSSNGGRHSMLRCISSRINGCSGFFPNPASAE